MLEALIASKTRIGLLKSLLLDQDGRFYLRELVAKTGMSQGSVQEELANLTRAGILEKEVSGRQTYYRANKRCPILPELRSILIKTVAVADVIRDALQSENESIHCAFVFGSFARGEAVPESDIDLFVIGDLTLRRLVTAIKSVPVMREINPVAMSPDEFRSRLKEQDRFVKTVLEGEKLFVIGDEDELRRLAE